MSARKRVQENMIICRVRILALALACVFAAGGVHADDSSKWFSVRGFGTLGVTHSNTSQGDYVANVRQPAGAGFSHDWAIGVDSKLGVQFDAKLTEQLTGVVQIVSEYRADKTYKPRLEWANMKYQPHPDFSVRVGRIRSPTFMVADSRLVGYAIPWIRPPIETYNLAPITKSDGIDAAYRANFGTLTNTVQAIYGNQSEDFISSTGLQTNVVSARIKHWVGMVDTLETGPWMVRAAIYTGNVSIEGEEAKVRLYNAGASYDAGSWFIQSEWTMRDSPITVQGLVTQRQSAFYATAGYRWNQFTPYVTYSGTWPSGNPPSSPARSIHQKTYSAGLRWDVARNTAVKAQFDRVSLGNDPTDAGYFINPQPGFPFRGKVNVFSIAVDFVF